MQNPFAEVLNNMFITEQGELRRDLDTSKSKVAEKIRKDRRKSAFLHETKGLRKEIVFCRKLAEESRKEGMRLQGEERTMKFQIAATAEKRARELQEEISKLAKKYRIK